MASTTGSSRLEDQAAATALHHQQPPKQKSVLDEDGRLSSASAAMSLKYAQAQDLPSFPSAGLKLSSAGAAASLADSNKKSFEHWKPDPIPAANRAAVLAKDYEMDPLWQPELSAAGSKAALLAHRDTPAVEIWKSKGTEHGHSAAGQALKSKPPNAITERNVPADARRKAMMAATGAMAGNRPRAGSTPDRPSSAQSWAAKAATKSHRDAIHGGAFTTGDPGFEAARIQNLAKSNVDRQMFGSTPPVSIEVEERNRQDTLRASAVAMAQKMYAIQQSHIDEASGVRRTDSRAAATSSHQRNRSEPSDDSSVAATPRYENLEEAARRLAQDRLKKMHDEHAEYRQYYGATSPPSRSRLSMRMGRRASTGAREEDSDDEERSRRIKKQMSIFQSKLAEVDNKKRQADRDALLEIAHRNVEAKMNKMDEKVFHETGKASPAQKELWERQARERARKQVDEAVQNVGKVHIGGGKYLDQSEVDAIARARLQPTLDEINDTAEKQRARDEEVRLEHERAQAQLAKEKAREAEVNAELKAAREAEKQELKAKKDEEKRVSKEQAAVEKEQRRVEAAAEKERLRSEKEEKRKSRDDKPKRFASLRKRGNSGAAAETDAAAGSEGALTSDTTPTVAAIGDTVHDQVTVPGAGAPAEPALVSKPEETVPATLTAGETPVSPSKRDSKVKTWFKSHMRGNSKSQNEGGAAPLTKVASDDIDALRDDSIRDVAMAGRETSDRPVSPIRETEGIGTSRSSSISSYSTQEETAEAIHGERSGRSGKKGLKQRLLNKIKPSKDESAGEPVSNMTDDEDFQEARDRPEEEALTPPTMLANRPASPRHSHDRSRFTEEL